MNPQTSTEPETNTIALPSGLSRIVLTGFMGAGKSTIGRKLAERLGWEFLDLDAHIEARTGMAIPEIFNQHGEPHFRRCESTALANALGRRNAVLALGGGAIESQTNQLLLEQTPGTVVAFLDAPFPVLYDRCMLQSQDRPVLADIAAAEARFRTRQPLYKRAARIVIDTTALSADGATEALVRQLASVIA